MANREIEVNFTGQEGIEPRLDRMVTSDTLETILAPGYLNRAAESAGVTFSRSDLMAINYGDGSGGTISDWFRLSYSGNSVITLVKETGEVSGPGSSYDNEIVLFSGTSGSNIKGVGFTPVIDSLLGFNGTATPANITAGTNISISGGVISATGSGTGNVVGPETSTSGGIAFFANTSGELLQDTPFSPVANSLVGYNSSGIPANITAGTNVTISGGTISVASGAGNVTGSGTPTAGTFPVYTNTSGLAIGPSPVALTANTLVGTNAGGTALTNITAGSGITISGGVIASTAGGGNVTGSGTSVAGLFPVYSDTTGLDLHPGSFSLTNDTLLGFNAGAIANITAGTGITISGGVISAPGAGGTITGPGSTALGALAVWDNVNGKVLSEPLFGTPSPNSLVGYGPSGNSIVNITAGANINISDEGVISASGGGGGAGNVTGPTVSVDGGLALYSGTTGQFIDNPAFTPVANTLLGYDQNGKVANITFGPGSLSINSGILVSYVPIINTSSGQALTAANNEASVIMSSSDDRLVALPSTSTIPIGYKVLVTNLSAGGPSVIVSTTDAGTNIAYRNSSGTPLVSNVVSILTFGTATFVYGGASTSNPTAIWQAYGNIT
jgi:Repeat of unknown function (DUF5907)